MTVALMWQSSDSSVYRPEAIGRNRHDVIHSTVFTELNMNATHVGVCLLIMKLCAHNQFNCLAWLFCPMFTFDLAFCQILECRIALLEIEWHTESRSKLKYWPNHVYIDTIWQLNWYHKLDQIISHPGHEKQLKKKRWSNWTSVL